MGCGHYCFNSTVQMYKLRFRAIQTALTKLTKSSSWCLNPAFLRQSDWYIAPKEDRTPFPQGTLIKVLSLYLFLLEELELIDKNYVLLWTQR